MKIQVRDYDTCPRCGNQVHVWEGEGSCFYIICLDCFLKTIESPIFEKIEED